MVTEALYAIVGGAGCYSIYHLLRAVRNGEFKKTGYDRPPVFLPRDRFGREGRS